MSRLRLERALAPHNALRQQTVVPIVEARVAQTDDEFPSSCRYHLSGHRKLANAGMVISLCEGGDAAKAPRLTRCTDTESELVQQAPHSGWLEMTGARFNESMGGVDGVPYNAERAL